MGLSHPMGLNSQSQLQQCITSFCPDITPFWGGVSQLQLAILWFIGLQNPKILQGTTYCIVIPSAIP
jgi:hypothetical protein